ncbi:MAG: DUF4364 family protein [Roseburia sp.]
MHIYPIITKHRNRNTVCDASSGEKASTRLDFTLTVQTKEQAEAICTNWQNQADDVFACLMDLLLK